MPLIPVVLRQGDDQKLSDPKNPLNKYLTHINGVISVGLKISFEELFAYCLYLNWLDQPGWKYNRELALKVPAFRGMFESFISENKGKILLTREPTRHIIEYLGVGAGLSLIKRLVGFTDADFARIKETSHPTMDYTYNASDGEKILEIETKGTHDRKSIHDHLKSIDDKKAYHRKNIDTSGNTVLFGTIFNIKLEKYRSEIILADPPINLYGGDPQFVKLINRLKYYYSELIKISRSHLAVSLINRINNLQNLGATWRGLDNIPLVNIDGEPIRIYETMAEPIWFDDGTIAHGRIYDLRLTPEVISKFYTKEELLEQIKDKPQRLYFRGIDSNVFTSISKQNFKNITLLKVEETVIGIKNKGYIYRKGKLLRLSSGLVVGTFTQENWDQEILPIRIEKILGAQ